MIRLLTPRAVIEALDRFDDDTSVDTIDIALLDESVTIVSLPFGVGSSPTTVDELLSGVGTVSWLRRKLSEYEPDEPLASRSEIVIGGVELHPRDFQVNLNLQNMDDFVAGTGKTITLDEVHELKRQLSFRLP